VTIAAKHLDPLVGLDTHIILIPSPAGPIPTPLPHPYIGIVFDPMDYVPVFGATVYINGLPRGTAGTNGLATPPHIPMGGPFLKPPSNESEIFMGSATVLCDGEPQSFLGLPVLSCQDIGMPAPPRAKKKSVAKSLMLPTTVVLSIPMGMLVLIGGPPTISMMAVGMKLGMSALKLLKKLGPIARGFKALSQKLHNLAAKLMKKLGLGDGMRNAVHRALCKVTGHPVDVASGKLFTDAVDFEMGGPIPIKWERVWFSTSTYRGPLGHGWHHSFDHGLYVTPEVVLYRTGDGRHVGLPPQKRGGTYYSRREKLTFFRDDSGYAVRDSEDLTYRFVPCRAGSAEHRLEQITDPFGHSLRFHYDAQGRLHTAIDSSGRVLEFTHDSAGRITSVVAPHPTLPGQRIYAIRYGYDGYGNLAETYDALGQPQRYVYQGQLLVRETNKNGLSFYFAWDKFDDTARCVRTWGDGGIYDHKLTYDTDLGITVVEDSLGHKTTYVHDGAMVHEVIDALGNKQTTAYDQDYLVVEETDALGLSSRYAYDGRGNLVETVAPDGTVTRTSYGPGDLPETRLDELGGVWTWKHDQFGRIVERTDPLGRSAKIEYAGAFAVRAIDADGNAAWFEHDVNGNTTAFVGPDGNTTRYAYDQWGNLIAMVDAQGNQQRRELDLLGRITSVIDPEGGVRSVEYDPEGNATRVASREYDVRFVFQGMGALVARSEADAVVRFEYDTEEQLTAIVNEHGDAYRFRYGPTGTLDEEVGFDGGARRYTRDAAGRVRRVDRPGGRYNELEYDAAGRVLSVRYSDGSHQSFGYRADGELVLAANGTLSVEFERDPIGRIVKEIQGDHWVQSEYSATGERIRVTSSLGADQAVRHDLAGDVTEVRERSSGYATSYRRDAFGMELERVLPGGVFSRIRRDRMSRALDHTVELRTGVLRAVGYTFDGELRLRRSVDAARGPTEYGHDARGRLSWARHPDQTVEYRVADAVGNLFRSPHKDDRSYSRSGELLSASSERGVTDYVYDLEGNLVEKIEPDGRSYRYEWNDAGLLVKVVRPGGSAVAFAYDALGRRVSKSYRGRTTYWVWDGETPLHEWVEGELERSDPDQKVDPSLQAVIRKREAELLERLSQGPPKAHGSAVAPITWLFEPDTFSPLAKLVGGETYSIVSDDLGVPVLMLDRAGRVAFRAATTPYGELRELEGDRDACPFRFPGQYEDAETGLYYNNFRYYDPETGGYISRDPSDLEGGLNPHAYVPDPLTWQDPLGLAAVCGPKIIVLGEGMGRVKKAVRALRKQGKDARWYQAWGKNFPKKGKMSKKQLDAALNRNERWLRDKIKKRYKILDIGKDKTRPSRSPFYKREGEVLKDTGYPSTPLPGF
jgi:RHS repeat-associated protein